MLASILVFCAEFPCGQEVKYSHLSWVTRWWRSSRILLLGWLCNHWLGATACEFNGYFSHSAIECHHEKDCNPLAGDSLDVCIAQHNKRWTTPEVQGSSRTNAIAVIAWILFIEAYLSVSGWSWMLQMQINKKHWKQYLLENCGPQCFSKMYTKNKKPYVDVGALRCPFPRSTLTGRWCLSRGSSVHGFSVQLRKNTVMPRRDLLHRITSRSCKVVTKPILTATKKVKSCAFLRRLLRVPQLCSKAMGW